MQRLENKLVNQFEKSVNAKLEGAVARQIQTQFQTSGKQILQVTNFTFLLLEVASFKTSQVVAGNMICCAS